MTKEEPRPDMTTTAEPGSDPPRSTLSQDTSTTAVATTPRSQSPQPPSQALLPITPPRSPKPDSDSNNKKVLLDTAPAPRRSHQEYLDSLQPPSEAEFARLARTQEQREQEHRRRDRDLQDQSASLAAREQEASRDFARARHHQHLHGLLEHARPSSRGRAMAAAEVDRDAHSVKSNAATLIQRHYRGYRVRREMQGLGLDAGTRWTHAIRDAQWKSLTTPRSRGDTLLSSGASGHAEYASAHDGNRPSSSTSAARQKWKKAATIAMRAGGDEDSGHSDEEDSDSSVDAHNPRMTEEQRESARKRRASMKAKRQKKAKMMGLQYFLEMVDVKHRYGSNLRQYHEQWKKSDTNENYFYWLDYGEGKNIELESCPRDRLEREQVRYLSREERQKYLVKVDAEGRLCWAKNGIRIDTTEEWKDSINGIVPVDDSTPAFNSAVEAHSQSRHHSHSGDDESSSDSEAEASESELEAARAAKYANPSLENVSGLKKVEHVSAATIFNKLLRKSVKKNTWIFVADTSFRLYVGIKASGSFQHSSFLQGSRISAAGLVKIKNGRLSSLSPLSGHYRPPASNFRAFVHSLRDEGVDMSRVSISKSYAVLVGLEAYVKTRRKGKDALQRVTNRKEKLVDPVKAARREEELRDKSESAELERRYLRKEEERQEENRGTFKFMQMLGLRLREPKVEAGPGNKT